MKQLLLFTFLLTSFFSYGQVYESGFSPDTIDYERTRMYINIPDESIGLSGRIEDEEGFSYYYLLPSENGKYGAIIIDYSVMNRNSLIDTEDFDIELWNTFNRNLVGSRCFKKDNLYYRIDRFEDGLEVFCIDVDHQMVDKVNKIFKSIYKKPRTCSDLPLSEKPSMRKSNRHQ